MDKRLYSIDETLKGVRIDKALSTLNEEWSRTQVQQWIKDDHVLVNGSAIKTNYKAIPGDTIEVTIPELEELDAVAEEMDLYGYADEIRQVLINIIFNAIDVLSQYRDDPQIEIKGFFVNDTHIKIEISNNGPIIPDNLLKSIFEPFVTTKTLGTGLGLFVCREIIEKHKGILACSSEPDKTSFIMLLPLTRIEI